MILKHWRSNQVCYSRSLVNTNEESTVYHLKLESLLTRDGLVVLLL